MTVKYVEYRELQNRGAVDPAPSSEVPERVTGGGILLVGTEPVLEFQANQSNYGGDYVSIYPAFHDGARRWLRREVWSPAYGYSASGTQETIILFEEGVRLFLEQGVFTFPLPGKGLPQSL